MRNGGNGSVQSGLPWANACLGARIEIQRLDKIKRRNRMSGV
jgi:hypothetical protein